MCKNCYNSQMGVERRREQDEATIAFKSRQFKGYNDPEYIAANQRVIDASKAMQQLHNDYIFAMARERLQRREDSFFITHADKRGKQ